MTGFADADGFKICIQDCVLPGFRPTMISLERKTQAVFFEIAICLFSR